MNILVSACLLGMRCRYDGESRENRAVMQLLSSGHTLIPVCPEIYGGLPTPRTPCEIRNGHAITSDGRDVTENYLRGARETLNLARLYSCRAAILKERSPSCGRGQIHDGSFTGALCAGDGFTAALLAESGIEVFGETQTEKLKNL